MGPKRAKPAESDSDSSLPVSNDAMVIEGESSQLSEISAKLSLILSAINNLTEAVRDTNKKISLENTGSAVTEITKVIQEVDKTLKSTGIQKNSTTAVRNESFDAVEAEAMRIKASIAAIWDKKINARKDAYWAQVRNRGNVGFHEKWINMSPPVIPRYLQKFEITNENEDQRILRERSIINNYKTEIEMEKLRIASCHDRVRRLDTEMEEIVFSKCTGRVADCLMELYKRHVVRNEEISHKRWQNNERWLKKYEEEFTQKYQHSNPFFKSYNTYNNSKQQNNKTYADAVRGNKKPYNNQQRNNDFQNLFFEFMAKMKNESTGFRQQNSFYRNNGGGNYQRRSRYNNNNQQQTHFHKQHYGGRGSDRSNNNIEENAVTPENIDDFLDTGEDHNWSNVF